jgi:hypothetical protein
MSTTPASTNAQPTALANDGRSPSRTNDNINVTIGDNEDNDVTTPASLPALSAYPNMIPPNEPTIVATIDHITPSHDHRELDAVLVTRSK